MKSVFPLFSTKRTGKSLCIKHIIKHAVKHYPGVKSKDFD